MRSQQISVRVHRRNKDNRANKANDNHSVSADTTSNGNVYEAPHEMTEDLFPIVV